MYNVYNYDKKLTNLLHCQKQEEVDKEKQSLHSGKQPSPIILVLTSFLLIDRTNELSQNYRRRIGTFISKMMVTSKHQQIAEGYKVHQSTPEV